MDMLQKDTLSMKGYLLWLCFLAVSWCPTSLAIQWQDNLRPKLFCSMTDRDYTAFLGNVTSKNHFSQLFYTSTTVDKLSPPLLLIGARNIMYKVSADELRLKQTLVWHASDFDKESCSVKGKNKETCQNYIVVIQQYSTDPSRYLICGTNAFKPMCREYIDERGSYVKRSEFSGLGLAPFDPAHNSTAVLVGGELYSGTVADFTGVDPIIFREPLRTQQYDSVQLNSPDFVGSFEHQDFVYFFFREAAVEYINCGKAVFSRVARVCKGDQGGPNKAKNSWTSYLKTRLNCSVPGHYPFYFDEIQGISELVQGQYGPESDGRDSVIYATFTTPSNSIGASAVCAFRLREISDAFSGRFKEQRSSGENWLAVDDNKVPSPRPGICNNDTKSLPDQNLNFIKTHSLMDEPVQPFFGSPIVIRTGMVSRFTVIAIDPQIKTTDGRAFDVIFVGTTNGRVLKVINAQSAFSRTKVETIIIEELQVFSNTIFIKDVKVMGHGTEGQQSLGSLAVMSETEVRAFPVQRCDRASTCVECVALQDPYCAWEIRSSRCSSGDWTKNMASSFIQSITTGIHPHCPAGDAASASAQAVSQVYSYEKFLGGLQLGQVVNIIDESRLENEIGAGTQGGSGIITSDVGAGSGNGVQVVEPSQVLFSLETLIITVSAGAVAALVVGFVTGYCCGRKCRKEEDGHMPYPDTEYEYFEQRGGLARPILMGPAGAPLLPAQSAKLHDGRHEEVTYAEPDLVSGPLRQMPPPTANQLAMMAPPPPGPPTMMPGTNRYQPSIGGGPPSQGVLGGHYSSSLLNPQNKFNTIHAGGKRPLPSINQYESAAEAKLGSGKDPAYYARGRDNLNSYHMSTLGRSTSMRNKDPLNTHRSMGDHSNASSSEGSSGGGGNGLGTGGGGGKGSQVVDSAYGTTRSVKSKVYL
ncbi:hypothetical protein TCAL_04038 [Tigriopus californicus]|uniref:Sema domain-containing protein n=1 Tax=Tigriopus californicus TaxID=6832 RepID=A0A553PGD7_TIGCA|nr:semaphorin-1A-like isoform X1 [Tigriopus californicus]TRY76741.1 hypothetical protein TCAL_04038 [Tigriopus californicus]